VSPDNGERCHTLPVLFVVVLAFLKPHIRFIEFSFKPSPTRHNHTAMAAAAIATGYAANVLSTVTAVVATLVWTQKPSTTARLDQMKKLTRDGMKRIDEISHLVPQNDLDKVVFTYVR
jgi:hypothetical protein